MSVSRKLHGDERGPTLSYMHNPDYARVLQGRYAEADELLSRTLEARQQVNKDAPWTIVTAMALALLQSLDGRYEGAAELYGEALVRRREFWGAEHAQSLENVGFFASLCMDLGYHDEADAFLTRSLECSRRVNGERHSNTLCFMNHLARLRIKQGRYDQAESLFTDALEFGPP